MLHLDLSPTQLLFLIVVDRRGSGRNDNPVLTRLMGSEECKRIITCGAVDKRTGM